MSINITETIVQTKMANATTSTLPLSTELQQDLLGKNILDVVLEHKGDSIHQHLHEADCADEDKWTTLHWASHEYCTPLDTIKLLRKSYPPAVLCRKLRGAYRYT